MKTFLLFPKKRGRLTGMPVSPSGAFLGRKQLSRVLCCGNRRCVVCAGTNQRLEVRNYELS